MKKKLNCILLVDDDEGTNYFNQLIIAEMDIAEKVVVTWNGKEAIDYLTNQGDYVSNGRQFPQPDLIFLDINMPKMDGWDFLAAYEHLDEQQKAKIIIVMLTTSFNPNDQHRAAKISSVTDYKNKPLSEEIIREVVRKYFPESE